MSHPNNDLAWCSFVIENDYLQISNSISNTKQSFENLMNHELDQCNNNSPSTKPVRKTSADLRRFSKTITLNFGQRNQNQIENIRLKGIMVMAMDAAKNKGDLIMKENTELSNIEVAF